MENMVLMDKTDLEKMVTDAVNHAQQPTSQQPAETYLHGLQGLADHFGISITSAWRHSRNLPKYRIGRKLMFKVSEVEKQLKQS
ncbi:MAG: DNA-binding protein [Sphingobacteriia bacterium]|nr:DNA-binding protein [Sphingobacteriia bacterium]